MGLDQEALEPDHQLVPAAVRATEPGNGEDQGPSPPVQSPAEAPEGSPPKTDLRLQAVPEASTYTYCQLSVRVRVGSLSGPHVGALCHTFGKLRSAKDPSDLGCPGG